VTELARETIETQAPTVRRWTRRAPASGFRDRNVQTVRRPHRRQNMSRGEPRALIAGHRAAAVRGKTRAYEAHDPMRGPSPAEARRVGRERLLTTTRPRNTSSQGSTTGDQAELHTEGQRPDVLAPANGDHSGSRPRAARQCERIWLAASPARTTIRQVSSSAKRRGRDPPASPAQARFSPESANRPGETPGRESGPRHLPGRVGRISKKPTKMDPLLAVPKNGPETVVAITDGDRMLLGARTVRPGQARTWNPAGPDVADDIDQLRSGPVPLRRRVAARCPGTAVQSCEGGLLYHRPWDHAGRGPFSGTYEPETTRKYIPGGSSYMVKGRLLPGFASCTGRPTGVRSWRRSRKEWEGPMRERTEKARRGGGRPLVW